MRTCVHPGLHSDFKLRVQYFFPLALDPLAEWKPRYQEQWAISGGEQGRCCLCLDRGATQNIDQGNLALYICQ